MITKSSRGIMVTGTAIVLGVLLVGCAGLPRPVVDEHDAIRPLAVRSPILSRLQLTEGLNVIDRASSGLGLAARVEGDRVTDWRVFDDEGMVVFKKQSKDNLNWTDACLISGGEPGFHIDGRLACCWEGWGCLICTQDEQTCEMKCETQQCKDANGQALPPVAPEDPSDRPSVAVNPDRLIIAVDPESPGWTVMDAAGVRMHLAPRDSQDTCPICARSADSDVCWKLPCLPAPMGSAGER